LKKTKPNEKLANKEPSPAGAQHGTSIPDQMDVLESIGELRLTDGTLPVPCLTCHPARLLSGSNSAPPHLRFVENAVKSEHEGPSPVKGYLL
jgi:hypothetical protein